MQKLIHNIKILHLENPVLNSPNFLFIHSVVNEPVKIIEGMKQFTATCIQKAKVLFVNGKQVIPENDDDEIKLEQAKPAGN